MFVCCRNIHQLPLIKFRLHRTVRSNPNWKSASPEVPSTEFNRGLAGSPHNLLISIDHKNASNFINKIIDCFIEYEKFDRI